MGIPGFARWLLEKYPKILEKGALKPGQYDNLYIDMNGIIHPATHPETPENPGEVYDPDEGDMLGRIEEYLEHLVELVQPRELLFLSIDGPAPRAKLNQQRARRYESARERRKATEGDDDWLGPDKEEVDLKQEMETIKESLDLGIFGELPEDFEEYQPVSNNGTEDPLHFMGGLLSDQGPQTELISSGVDSDLDAIGWDSNCITPGTAFMDRVAKSLKKFIQAKQSSDDKWSNIAVILSDSNTYGEGEHKLMDHIRAQRCQPSYSPNTRHLLCGLDADFILLALASHEAHCHILRERKNRLGQDPIRKTRYDIMNIATLREYLVLEHAPYFSPGTMDMERVIDDFVLMSTFLGNDFLPSLPTAFVDSFAMDHLMKIYKTILPGPFSNGNGGGYLTMKGEIDYHFLGKLLQKYTIMEDGIFLRAYNRHLEMNGKLAIPDQDLLGCTQWIDLYYSSILCSGEEEKRRMCIEYLSGVSWVFSYYTSNAHHVGLGIPDRPLHSKEASCHWRWFYPFHYSALTRDMAQLLTSEDCRGLIEEYKLRPSKPFKPFEQLLAVLPPDSAGLLPDSYKEKMFSETLAPFYPKEYTVDRNGREQEWKAIIRLPFVDEKVLIDATKDCELNAEEKSRNALNSHCQLFLGRTSELAQKIQKAGTIPVPGAQGNQIKFHQLPKNLAIAGFVRPSLEDCCKPAVSGPVVFDFLDPSIPEDNIVHSLHPKAVTQPPVLKLYIKQKQTGPLTKFGTFFCAILGLVYATACVLELVRYGPQSSLSDSLYWMAQMTSLFMLQLGFGLFLTAEYSLAAYGQSAKAEAKRVLFACRHKFIRDQPMGTYKDWTCDQCSGLNFWRNFKCFICSAKKKADAMTVYSHKNASPAIGRLIVDHRSMIQKYKGWPCRLQSKATR